MYFLVGLIIGVAMLWVVMRGIDGLLDFFGLTVFDPPRGLSPFERGPRPNPPGFPVLPPLAKAVGRPPLDVDDASDADEGDRWKN
jgi:hypothetical protein